MEINTDLEYQSNLIYSRNSKRYIFKGETK